MFPFGNAKAVDLKHLLSSILNFTLEQHFLFKIVLNRVKQKVTTNRTQLNFWSSKMFQANSKSFSPIKKPQLIRELLFHLAADLLFVQFPTQVLKQDTHPPSNWPGSIWNPFFVFRARVRLGSHSGLLCLWGRTRVLVQTAEHSRASWWLLCTTVVLALMAPTFSSHHPRHHHLHHSPVSKRTNSPYLEQQLSKNRLVLCMPSRNWVIWYSSYFKSRAWINTFYVTLCYKLYFIRVS